MASQTKSAGTGVDDSSVGTETWSNPGNIVASDNSRASIQPFTANSTSHYLKATNFGFSIPSGATIDGITVRVEKAGSGGAILDNAVRIVKGGTIGATDRSDGSAWPLSDAYVSHGGSPDLWGTTWTVANINATDFGVAVSAKNVLFSAETALVDHIEIIVNYTEPTTTSSSTSSSSTTSSSTSTSSTTSSSTSTSSTTSTTTSTTTTSSSTTTTSSSSSSTTSSSSSTTTAFPFLVPELEIKPVSPILEVKTITLEVEIKSTEPTLEAKEFL